MWFCWQKLFGTVYEPLPIMSCQIKTEARSNYVFRVPLFLDAIAISRYIFVFILKKLAAFQDEFWCFFINLWIQTAGLLTSIVWNFQTNHPFISYYICSGEDPNEDFKKPLKTYGIVEIGSLIIHLIVHLRIKLYKVSTSNQHTPGFNKNNFFSKY